MLSAAAAASWDAAVKLVVEMAALRADAAKAVALSTIVLRTKRGDARCASRVEAAAGSPSADDSTDDGDAEAEAEENAEDRVDANKLDETSAEASAALAEATEDGDRGGDATPNAADTGEDEFDHEEGGGVGVDDWRSRWWADTANVSGSVSSVGMANAGGSKASADGDGGGLYDATGKGDPFFQCFFLVCDNPVFLQAE